MVRGFRAVSGLSFLATAASLGLHAALLATLGWRAAPTSDAPLRPPIILSLAAPSLARAVTPEPPASADSAPADESAAAQAPAAAAVPPSSIPPVETAGDAAREAQAITEAALPVNAVPAPGSSAPVEASAADATVAAEPAPPAETGTAAPRAAPAVPEVTRPVQITEAAPPTKAVPDPGSPPSVEAPAADATVAAEPAPPAEMGTAATRAAPAVPEVTRPVHIAEAAPPVKAVPDPGSLLSVESSEVATPEAALPASPQSVPPIPPDVGSARDVSLPTAQALAPDAPSAAAAVVPPPEARVATLDAPTVSAERIRGFVDRYDGGPCFFASVARTTPTGADIDSFSSSVEQVMAFHGAFMGQLGVEPDVMGQRVWKAQCPAVEFLRRTRSLEAQSLTIEIDRREIRGGDVVKGIVRHVGEARIALLLVSESGSVIDLSGKIAHFGEDRPFAWTLTSNRKNGFFPELIVAAVEPSTSGFDSSSLASLVQSILDASRLVPQRVATRMRTVGILFLLDGR